MYRLVLQFCGLSCLILGDLFIYFVFYLFPCLCNSSYQSSICLSISNSLSFIHSSILPSSFCANPYIILSVNPFINKLIQASTHPLTHPTIHPSNYPSMQPTHPPTHSPIHPFTRPPNPSIHFARLLAHPSIRPVIHLGFPLTPKWTFLSSKNRSETSKIVGIIVVSNEYTSKVLGYNIITRPILGL